MDISGLLLWPRKQFRLFFKILLDIWSPQGFEANRVSIVLVAVRESEVEIQIEISLLVPARAWVEVGAGGTRVRLLGTIAYRRELVCSCKRKDDEYGRSTLKILVKS